MNSRVDGQVGLLGEFLVADPTLKRPDVDPVAAAILLADRVDDAVQLQRRDALEHLVTVGLGAVVLFLLFGDFAVVAVFDHDHRGRL